MRKSPREQIEEILDGLQCPKGYVCYTSGRENLCRAKDIGLESFLVCLERIPSECRFSVCFGDIYFCQCPLRVYIARKVTK
jgi:hypothetical protein